MNRKGQALVEFVLILPVFLFILFTIVDFGMLFYSKSKLETTSTDIVRMMMNGEEQAKIENTYDSIEIDVMEYKENYQKIILKENVKMISPVLHKILGKYAQIKVERVIPNA